MTELDSREVPGALEQLGAREVLFPGDLPLLAGDDPSGAAPRFVRTELEEWIFTQDYADRTLRDHFKLLTLDGVGLANRPAAISAAGAILHYLRDTQRAALDHLDRPTYFDRAESMILDAVTVRNLELVEPLFAADAGGPQQQATCWPRWINRSREWAGRLLRQRLLRPSLDRAEIEQRLDAVENLLQQTILRAELRKQLGGILDLERLLAKVTLGSAGPRDLLALGPLARENPGTEALLRYPAGRTATLAPREIGRTARRRRRDSQGDLRRASARHRRWRNHSRRVPCRTRRTARSEPERAPVHRAD
ncbi:MAG: hypothetical protein WDO73_13220 [Ignavibacteriota bacterium]